MLVHEGNISHIRDICNSQMGLDFHDNARVKKISLKDRLATNLDRLMRGHVSLTSPQAVEARCKALGIKVGKSSVDRIRKAEVSTTLDTVDSLAAVFGVGPLEILAEPAEEGGSESVHSIAVAAIEPDDPPVNLIYATNKEIELLSRFREASAIGKKAIIGTANVASRDQLAGVTRDGNKR